MAFTQEKFTSPQPFGVRVRVRSVLRSTQQYLFTGDDVDAGALVRLAEQFCIVVAQAQFASFQVRRDLELVYTYFPRLKERRRSQSGYTSGGEQQMTAIGRALMARPSMILLDEPSMGLAPQVVEEIFEIVRMLNEKENVSFLLAEQNTAVALRYADYGYILENGRVVMDGPGADLGSNEDVKEFYLGLSAGGRKSFRDAKHYRRRKRWLA